MDTKSLARQPRNRTTRGIGLYLLRGEDLERTGPETWRVPNGRGARYTVSLEHESCTCPDYRNGDQPVCKHQVAAMIAAAKRRGGGGGGQRLQTCSGCGERYRTAELTEYMDGGGSFANHDNLTWFDGDRLCAECADNAGVSR